MHLSHWLTFHRRSIVTRLVLFAVALVALGVILRIGTLLPFLRERLIELSASHQLSIAEYVAKDIDGKIRTRLEALARLAAQLPPDLLRDPVRLERWLQSRHDNNPQFSRGLVVIAADGHGATADYPVSSDRRALDYSDSDYFGRAVNERRAVVGKPLRGRVAGEPLIILAAPVLNGRGEVAAVLAGVTALAAPGFFNLLQETRIGETGGFLLISPRDNLFVAATDTTKILTALPPPGKNPLHDKAMAGYRGTGITVNIHGVEELSAMVSIPVTDWFLVARVPTSEALQALDSARDFVIRNAFLNGFIVIVIGGLALHRFFRPLTLTSRLIKRMAHGEIELQPVPVGRCDEIGELAEGFNVLVTRLGQIGAEKQDAERLRTAEKERMEISLRQWMADTSHELRTPIAVLRAQIEAIHDGVNVLDARTLAVLHGEVMGLSRLVDDLHTLARSDVGQLDCHLCPVAPLDLLDDVIFAFRERIAAAGLMIELAERPTTDPIVAGDPVRLRQVFSNLLENALRYTDSGGWLRVGAAIVADRLTIQFEDSAPGVPPDALPYLFDRFFRVDASRSRTRGGSGIGLAVCQSIVAAHSGQITAGPSALGGLCVTVSLPLHPSEG
jgi:signal transduction histidine kinase